MTLPNRRMMRTVVLVLSIACLQAAWEDVRSLKGLLFFVTAWVLLNIREEIRNDC